MMLALLLAQVAPRDLTPKEALAPRYQYSARDIAKSNGLVDLQKSLLPRGEIEARYWGGFAWGTSGLILHRKDDRWSATVVRRFETKAPKPFPAPKSGWPAFWIKAERLGLFTLPDEEQAGSKTGYRKIFDGYSTLVEYQRDGVYRAYGYNNPQHQESWTPAKSMTALDRFIEDQFPNWRR